MIETPTRKRIRAREVLDHMVECLNQGGQESKALWDIVTAMRGPDNGNDDLKDVTTTRLRRVIGLKAALADGDGILYNYGRNSFTRAIVDETGYAPVPRSVIEPQFNYETGTSSVPMFGEAQRHFAAHYENARTELINLGYSMGREQK